jgi:hypothetical protein
MALGLEVVLGLAEDFELVLGLAEAEKRSFNLFPLIPF